MCFCYPLVQYLVLRDDVESFWIGFGAGFFANWVFGVITRMLPARWVRYRVRFSKVDTVTEGGFSSHLLVLIVEPPVFRKALMPPLVEDVEVTI